MTDRRFVGTQNLYGEDFLGFAQAHVYVVGVGGVGSWVAEALARTGVGELTLVDMDVLVESNVNRQLPALSTSFGESKVAAMAARIVGINPNVRLHLLDDFVTADNVADILPTRQAVRDLQAQGKAVVVLDCIDDMAGKLALALHCRFNKIKLIVSGGAGGKVDPTTIAVSDLKDVHQDPLLAKLRHQLRAKNINKNLHEKFGVRCVYSTEAPKVAKTCTSGLGCTGYGSAVVMTATIGMVMVAECLKVLGRRSG